MPLTKSVPPCVHRPAHQLQSSDQQVLYQKRAVPRTQLRKRQPAETPNPQEARSHAGFGGDNNTGLALAATYMQFSLNASFRFAQMALPAQGQAHFVCVSFPILL